MAKKSQLIYLTILAACSLTLAVNLLEANFDKITGQGDLMANKDLVLANISGTTSQNQEVVDSQDWQAPAPSGCLIQAKSALSAQVAAGESGNDYYSFSRNAEEARPLASLSKLMTAIIADEFYQPNYQITISQKAISQLEESGFLRVGERHTVKNLIYMALIESSNDAAYALAEPMGVDGFVALMNLKAESMGLVNTHFYNSNGLDPKEANLKANYSTADDLLKIAKYLLNKPSILEIIGQKEYAVYLANGLFHHTMENTNVLLNEMPEIIGGKTGFTEQAGGCLLVISKTEEADRFKVAVVLGSVDRFGDIRKLLTCQSFKTDSTF